MYADNVYNNLSNNDDTNTTPRQYKQSWLLDLAAIQIVASTEVAPKYGSRQK